MQAFFNNPAIQKKYIDRVNWHYEHDHLMQGLYYDDEYLRTDGGTLAWEPRGCAVGCTIHSSAHEDYPELLGIPASLARLQDRIFETLPIEDAREWARAFLQAIPIGADLGPVKRAMASHVLQAIAEALPANYRATKPMLAQLACFAMHDQLASQEAVLLREKLRQSAVGLQEHGLSVRRAMEAAESIADGFVGDEVLMDLDDDPLVKLFNTAYYLTPYRNLRDPQGLRRLTFVRSAGIAVLSFMAASPVPVPVSEPAAV